MAPLDTVRPGAVDGCAAHAAGLIENRTFEEIAVGDTAQITRLVTHADIELFANVSGDVNPAHMDPAYAEGTMFHGVIAHGMFGGSLFSTILGTLLPGPGTIYLGQDLRFRKPVKPGDTLTAQVTVRETHADKQRVVLDCSCVNQDGREVISGTAEVIAPTEKVRRDRVDLPEVSVIHHVAYANLLARAGGLKPLPTAVVHPCDAVSLSGALEAAAAGFIQPVLVGPETRIRAVAASAGLHIGDASIVNAEHSHASAEIAVALARDGVVQALMKGSLHTDELMHEVMRRDSRLRTERRISHAYVMLLTSSDRPLILTDCAINIAPSLEDKVDIAQNAIDLAIALGIQKPKVAVLSAVETVTPKIQSTLDAAALSKMAERGQIRGGVIDGPLALDNAVSADAARKKGIVSAVAGEPDILLVPNLEAGNILAKEMTFTSGADAAGIVLGAVVPIILTSRADSVRTRLASCAVAALAARAGG
ncbi:MAG: bifunctional enoyl-CoA hydratase/phosphate acetyltransferase [Acetobacteraceae bacterium]|nr:bifunctional enoyl-CoA hydratase/phosphate acetyltransferase [Pseudomonadota bacterium]